MALDEDSENPKSDRTNDANSRHDDQSGAENNEEISSSVGFMVDGIDLRNLDADEVEFRSPSLLDFDPADMPPVEPLVPLESLVPRESLLPSPDELRARPESDDLKFRVVITPAKTKTDSGDGDKSGASKRSDSSSKQGDSKRGAVGSNPDGKKPRASNSKMPAQLWPTDFDKIIADSGEQYQPPSIGGVGDVSKAYKEFFNQNVVRTKNFRLSATSLAYPQISFGSGVKYSGKVGLSQSAMLILALAKTEALRQGCQEIGCEHILLALLQHHGFAAGQLILSLHLNAIGKPYALGDLAGTARKIIDGPNAVSFDRMSAITRGGKADMFFTAEADQMLIDAMYTAAQHGVPAVATKHILSALVNCDNEEVQAAFGALYVTKSEIQAALRKCPDTEDVRQFALYTLAAILYSIIRVRIFQGPVRKYKEFAVRKERVVERKDVARISANSSSKPADFRPPKRKKD
jgi:hypothetical protein